MKLKLIGFGLAAFLAACGGTTEKGGSNNGENNGAQNNGAQNNGGEPVAANCQSRCETKAVECGAFSEQAALFCQSEICSYQPLESELACMESGTCSDLDVFADPEAMDPCGIRDTSNGGSNNGTTPGNNGTTPGNNGGGCTLGDDPYCDGDVLVSCVEIAGAPATQRETCGVSCEDGECIEAWTLCEPKFSDGAGCADECNASGTVSVNGNTYCTSRCGSNGECPDGTECDTSLNGGTCLPPCQSALDCPDGFLEFCPESGFCGH